MHLEETWASLTSYSFVFHFYLSYLLENEQESKHVFVSLYRHMKYHSMRNIPQTQYFCI